ALVKRPHILIFDGIADGDPALMQRILAQSQNDPEATIIVGTSDPQVAKLMTTVAVMREGQLVATGGWDSVQQLAIDGPTAGAIEKEAS
ncbi:MAG: hypothetical protein AAFW98_03670, partial [Pseudomonadota bacterium]